MNPDRVPVVTPVQIDANEFWIPVHERLPEPGHLVLVAWRLGQEWIVETGYRRKDGSWEPGHPPPTHWMSMPAPPDPDRLDIGAVVLVDDPNVGEFEGIVEGVSEDMCIVRSETTGRTYEVSRACVCGRSR